MSTLGPVASTATLRAGWRVIGRGVREEKGWVALAIVGATVYGIMTVGTAWVIGRIVHDTVAPAIAAQSIATPDLVRAALILVAVVLVNVVGIVVRRVAAGVAVYNLGATYRRRVTRQYLRLPLAWHHRHPSGQLLSNANSDVESTWNVFQPLPMAFGVVVMLVFAAVQMVLVDPFLAAIGLTVFPMLLVVNLLFQRAMSPKVTRVQQMRAEVSEVAHESFEAALVVKSLGREDQEAERFTAVTHELRDANISVGRSRGVFDPAIEAIPTIGTLAVIAVGAWRIGTGHITAAEVVQIAYLFSILAFPVRALGWVLAEMPRSVVGWDRVHGVLNATGSMTYGTATVPERGAGTVQAQNVSYAYEVDVEHGGTERNPALSGVTLDIPAGGTTAVVGPTGSGKSTLTNLVVRLVDPDSGEVRLDGVDLREVRRGGVPEAAALVSQQTFMFDDTVRGNVTLGTERTDDEVWAALRVAQGHGFVGRLPAGLDTRVGERGTSLSGGQRQRVALARAVIREPQLLVLDDATSAVDPAVEQQILAALRQASSGTTVLVVAYRMATITLADDIVYLEEGRVVDHGTHDELLGRCDGYQRLVTAYAREAAERAAVAADEERATVGSRPMSMRSAPPVDHTGIESGQGRSTWQTLKRGVELSPEIRRGIGVTIALAVLSTVGKLLVPFVVQRTTDEGILAAGGPDAGIVLRYVLLAMVGVAVTALCSYFVNVRLFTASENGLSSLRIKAFRHIHDLSVLTQNTERRGSLVSRVTSDVDTISMFVQFGGLMFMVNIAQLLLATRAHGHLQPAARGRRVGLLRPAVLHHPPVPGHRRPGLHRGSRAGRRHARRRSPRRSSERRPSARTASRTAPPSGSTSAVEAHRRSAVRAQTRAVMAFTTGQLVSGLTTAVVIVVGTLLAVNGSLTLGELLAFLFLVNLFTTPVQQATEILNEMQNAVAGWRRVIGIIDTRADVADPAETRASSCRAARSPCGFDDVVVRLPGRRDRAPRRVAADRPAVPGGDRGGDRFGQVDAGQAADPADGPVQRRGHHRRRRPATSPVRRRCGTASSWCRRRASSSTRSLLDNIRFGAPEATEDDVRLTLDRAGPRLVAGHAAAGSRAPTSASAASRCRPASGSWSRSPAPTSPTRTCWSSTRRRPPSTRAPRSGSSGPSTA